MNKTQKNIVWGLLGLLLFCISLFRIEFFTQSEFTVLLMKIWTPASVLLMVVAGGHLFKVHWLWVLLPVLAIEMGVFTILQLAKHRVELPSKLLYFAREIYSVNERNISSFNENLGHYDSTLFYTLKPGKHTFDNLEFSTTMKVNQAGFRDDEASMERPSIVCLGDSYAMGWGVEAEEAYPDLLEKKLDRRTLNLGMASYGTAREYVAFKKFVPQGCDLVILQYCGNDEDENAAFIKNNFQLQVSPEAQYRTAQLNNKLWRSYFPLKYFYAALSFCARESRRWLARHPENELATHSSSLVAMGKAPEWTEHLFKILALLKTSHAGKIIVFHVDSNETPPDYRRQLESWLSVNQMDGVYIFPADTYLSKEDYFVLDDHLNPGGHRKLAEALAKFINDKHIFNPSPSLPGK